MLFDRVQQLMWEAQPVVFLVSPHILAGAANRVGDFQPAVLSSYTLWNADQLFIRVKSADARRQTAQDVVSGLSKWGGLLGCTGLSAPQRRPATSSQRTALPQSAPAGLQAVVRFNARTATVLGELLQSPMPNAVVH
jgi:hypothetical protein